MANSLKLMTQSVNSGIKKNTTSTDIDFFFTFIPLSDGTGSEESEFQKKIRTNPAASSIPNQQISLFASLE